MDSSYFYIPFEPLTYQPNYTYNGPSVDPSQTDAAAGTTGAAFSSSVFQNTTYNNSSTSAGFSPSAPHNTYPTAVPAAMDFQANTFSMPVMPPAEDSLQPVLDELQ